MKQANPYVFSDRFIFSPLESFFYSVLLLYSHFLVHLLMILCWWGRARFSLTHHEALDGEIDR
jgi:hypothetical protein